MNETLPSLVVNEKPKVILFYKNGDRNFRGYHVTVTPRRFKNFDNLLNELTRITSLVQGARYVFTPHSGTRVQNLEELHDGKSYVCGSYPKLKKINYGCRPDGSDRKKIVNRNFIPASHMTNQPMHYDSDRSNLANVKPKIITIIRNSIIKPRKTVKILLNKRTAQTYDQVLNDVTSAVGVEGGSGVRKLFSSQGKLVLSLSELFEEENIFIAVGNEKFRAAEAAHILEDSGFGKARSKSQRQRVINQVSPTSLVTPHQVKQLPLKKLPDIKSKKEIENINETKKDKKIKKKKQAHEIDNINVNKNESRNSHVVIDHDLEKEKEKSNPILEHLIDDEKDPSKESGPEKTIESILSETSNQKSLSPQSDEKLLDQKESLESDSDTSEEQKSQLTDNMQKENEKEITQEETTHAVLSRESTLDSQMSNSTSSDNTIKENNDDLKKEISINDFLTNKKASLKDDDTLSIKSSSTTFSNKSVLPDIPKRQSEQIESSNNMIELFDIGKKLGDGNFAVVKQATDKKTGKKYALKIIDGSKLEGKEEMLQNEIRMQRDCFHPNIVQLFHDFHAPTEIFLVMELVSGGDFFDLISENIKFDEEDASLYMRDLCSGLDYLHQRKIVHRDIKPENLMVCESPDGSHILKLADFGLAMNVTEPIFTICGTPTYVAPEILTEKGYGLEVDVWAAGVILYIMLCGFPPFRSPNRKQTELFDLIEAGEFEYLEPYWDDVSDLAKDLIDTILNIDNTERVTSAQILSHKWLTQYGLTRNNTMDGQTKLSLKNKRFKAVVRGIQSINRMKNLVELQLERGEDFITHVSHSNHSNISSAK